MQMEQGAGGSLSLLLTDSELAAFGVCFDQLDHRDPKTRRLLRRLLGLARQKTGFVPTGNLTVEALPLEGGCLLLLTPEPVPPAVFWLEADGLLQLAASLARRPVPTAGDSALFQGEGGFWLVVCDAPPPPVVEECGVPLPPEVAAHAAEHGRPVFPTDALWHLARAVTGT